MNHSTTQNRTVLLLAFVLHLPFSVSAQNQNSSLEVSNGLDPVTTLGIKIMSQPREERLVRGHTFHGDVRTLPQVPPHKFELPEREDPQITPMPYPGTAPVPQKPPSRGISTLSLSAPAP